MGNRTLGSVLLLVAATVAFALAEIGATAGKTRVVTRLAITQVDNVGGVVVGHIRAERPVCLRRRVVVYEGDPRSGGVELGGTRSDRSGDWEVTYKAGTPIPYGDHYARTPRKVVFKHGRKIVCLPDVDGLGS